MVKAKNEINYLVEEFSLKAVRNHQLLNDWLAIDSFEIDNLSEQILQKVESRLYLEIDSWLEEELKMQLLSIIFFLSDLKEPDKIGLFFERPIMANIGDIKIDVKVDCMISSVYGLALPKMPYFFMQEFKKSKGDKQDPEGQMLAAMLAGQHLNNNGKPMYGSYVIGRDWFFSTLHGKEYAKSEALQLTQPAELRQVILTLRKLKQIILNDLAD
jgi:hypothetical protein